MRKRGKGKRNRACLTITLYGGHIAKMQKDAVREVVDWERLKETVKGMQEGDVREKNRWYGELRSDSPYAKMKGLHVQQLKTSRQGK